MVRCSVVLTCTRRVKQMPLQKDRNKVTSTDTGDRKQYFAARRDGLMKEYMQILHAAVAILTL